MNTCRSCRWWEAQHQQCHKRFTDVINDKREFQPDSLRVSLGYAGGGIDTNEWWVHNVFTGPDFGCIHHEPTQLMNRAAMPEGVGMGIGQRVEQRMTEAFDEQFWKAPGEQT